LQSSSLADDASVATTAATGFSSEPAALVHGIASSPHHGRLHQNDNIINNNPHLSEKASAHSLDADCFFSPDSQAAAHSASPFSAVRALLGFGTTGETNSSQTAVADVALVEKDAQSKGCQNEAQDMMPMLVNAEMTAPAAVAARLLPSEGGAFAHQDRYADLG
jgi:hypothetical protein